MYCTHAGEYNMCIVHMQVSITCVLIPCIYTCYTLGISFFLHGGKIEYNYHGMRICSLNFDLATCSKGDKIQITPQQKKSGTTKQQLHSLAHF